MTEVVWTILRRDDRFLLAQRSLADSFSGTWTFPGGEKDRTDPSDIIAAYRELKEKVGLKGGRFRKLCHIYYCQHRIKFFLRSMVWRIKTSVQRYNRCRMVYLGGNVHTGAKP